MIARLSAARQAPMSLYRAIVRPILFGLSPDHSHALAHWALRAQAPWQALAAVADLAVDDPRLRTRFAGVDLPNPIGLAAGFDKNCELIGALSQLGFGFLTVGSIMPEPRFGNPFPRLVRYRESESLADAMGVPSRGLGYCVARLSQVGERKVPIFANIGGFSADAIAASFFALETHADAIEISLMCPNVLRAGERFDDIGLLEQVLARIAARRKPAIVRVPNDTARSSDRLAELIERCVVAGIEGLKVAGGEPVAEPGLGVKQGTLHGRATFDAALDNVARAAKFARGRIPIKGNGGIASAADVVAMLRAGATCVDLYSSFIYRGWSVARDINRELAPMLAELASGRLARAPTSAGGCIRIAAWPGRALSFAAQFHHLAEIERGAWSGVRAVARDSPPSERHAVASTSRYRSTRPSAFLMRAASAAARPSA